MLFWKKMVRKIDAFSLFIPPSYFQVKNEADYSPQSKVSYSANVITKTRLS